jgi:hypothetical protein
LSPSLSAQSVSMSTPLTSTLSDTGVLRSRRHRRTGRRHWREPRRHRRHRPRAQANRRCD